ncbi:hypothetical protein CLOBOL_05407 [Enterocloster bolteae ATCC BAA-613]|uniref:Uncharacterized protein n=1 Tax=Enterocloster bolteae (strain ATCC BAA-613 / DSM 15670 / CCUG 46953 / JCM 12243 / WAL 16351) TaxID=411902 RepID=A8RZF8_ENTBW|nr:hypothetical protein CLOBOL_05407 [Enterocloster bolteae ATCC BAA-613]
MFLNRMGNRRPAAGPEKDRMCRRCRTVWCLAGLLQKK